MDNYLFIEILITLSKIKGVGKKNLLLFALGLIEKPIANRPDDRQEYISLIHEICSSNKRLSNVSLYDIEQALNYALEVINMSRDNGVKIISMIDDLYPENFHSIKDRPVIIYCLGDNLSVLNKKSISIIGCRNISSYAKKIGTRLVKSVIAKSYVVVSGLALGSDTIAHNTCVGSGAETIAVMAGGLNSIYPKENILLAKEILKHNGLLISEYPWGTKPTRYSFVERDRLQAALSAATIILETKVDGGSMHTANFTINQNKKNACLYSHVNDKLDHIDTFQGNKFLVEKKNAYMLSDESDLIRFIDEISIKQEQIKFLFAN